MAGRAFAAMLLSLVLGTSVAQPAPADGVAAGKTNALLAAPPSVAPASVPMSPHARAARQRAAAQAEAGPSGIRVSPFTARRKPHNLGGRR
jgi:uncharacterized cupredoxin-like copper-binding protein